MNSLATNTVSTIIPSLRYDDALKAIDWLCNAFGFEKQAVYADDKGVVQHAQLTFGNGMIMLGSTANGSAWGDRIAQPVDRFQRVVVAKARDDRRNGVLRERAHRVLRVGSMRRG